MSCKGILNDDNFPVDNNQLAVALAAYNGIFGARSNRLIVFAPPGSGKSHMVCAMMVMIAIRNRKTDFLVV